MRMNVFHIPKLNIDTSVFFILRPGKIYKMYAKKKIQKSKYGIIKFGSKAWFSNAPHKNTALARPLATSDH